jgi:hypothetical protein
MRTHLSPLPFAVLAALPLAAHAAFDGPFALVDATSPAGVYTDANEISTLGAWSAGFFAAECGTSFIDTRHAPESVTLGASTARLDGFSESFSSLFIEFAQDDYVSFTVDVINQGEDSFAAGLEIYLDGDALYSLTELSTAETPVWSYNLGFSVSSGQTLEFRATTISSGTSSFASNCSTISQFALASAIPEPAAAATLVGLAALGLAGRRRRTA